MSTKALKTIIQTATVAGLIEVAEAGKTTALTAKRMELMESIPSKQVEWMARKLSTSFDLDRTIVMIIFSFFGGTGSDTVENSFDCPFFLEAWYSESTAELDWKGKLRKGRR